MAVDAVDDVDALFGLDPLVRFGEAGIGANGGDDAVGGWRDVGDTFEKEIEDSAKIVAALGVEADGASVAIDGTPVEGVVDGKLAANGLRGVPVDEKLLDGFAVRVVADLAFAAMALEIGSRGRAGFWFGAVLASAQRGFGMSYGCGGHLLFLLWAFFGRAV